MTAEERGVRVLITDDRFGDHDEESAILAPLGAEIVAAPAHDSASLAALGKGCAAILCNQARLDASVIDALDECLVISRYGIGYDNVDLEAAAARGIWVANVPGYCADEVAEHALGLLIACLRRIPACDAAVRAGAWNLKAPARRIAGLTLAIIGYGSSGSSLQAKAAGFGFKEILIVDPRAEQKLPARGVRGVRAASWDEALAAADVLSFHAPLKEGTRRMLDAGAIARMKDGAVVINTARGGLIDESALAEALVSGKISAAGLDVFEREPPEGSPLLGMDNVVLSDHRAFFSAESVIQLRRTTALNAADALAGRTPRHTVNRPRSPRTADPAFARRASGA
jgi:D-3-phosphoglycerate dehydrogenase / 2-oxoglutarate reductase